ncbi:MAG: NYN domain-containing protein [Candidatus Brocadiaceae bacterium]|jgi:hypothetical protein
MKVYVDGNDLCAYFVESDDAMVVDDDRLKTRDNLRRWLARYAQLHECDVVLVWDEAPADQVLPPTERFGRVKVVNLPFGEEARAEIAGPANRTAVEERTFVVTEDPRLIDALRRGRATVQGPARFVARARKKMGKADEELAREPDEKFTGLSEDDVDFWLDFFSEND